MQARTLAILVLCAPTLWLSTPTHAQDALRRAPRAGEGPLTSTPAHAQSTLRLSRTARVEADAPIRLGDIAVLSGARAGELGGLILVEDPSTHPTDAAGWFQIGIDVVRQTVEERLGAAAGLVAMRGNVCDIRVLGKARPVAEPTNTAAAAPTSSNADGLVGMQTVRGAIARELSRILRTPPEDLRLTFGVGDTATLDTPTVGRIVQIDPIGSSSRMPVRVSVYEPNRLVLRESLRVGVLVKRQVAVVSRAVLKRGIIGKDDITTETRWVSPTDRFVSPEVAIGSAAVRSLRVGEALELRAVQPPVLIEKGDPVTVRVILEGIVLRRAAYARESGRAGETIEFSPQHEPKIRFRATVIGKGEAQVWTFGQGDASGPTPGARSSRRGTAVASGSRTN
ncbi:MAG: flagellar basal body P-ring formation chaperone FlgA [Planctomycetota bacterium]|nr:flagellar basal body P-ring formation chaperone FlgA [Planctomycetota bacterium]